MMLGVTERDQGGGHPPFTAKVFSRPTQYQKRFAAGFLSDINAPPAHRFADPGAERFRDRLLRGETRRQMAGWKFHRHRILDFTNSKNAMEKSFSKSVERMLNPCTLDQIHSDADHAHAGIVESLNR